MASQRGSGPPRLHTEQRMPTPPELSAAPATSHQKSCDRCVRGKRRCNRVKPVCARCAHQGWACQYGGREVRENVGAPSSGVSGHVWPSGSMSSSNFDTPDAPWAITPASMDLSTDESGLVDRATKPDYRHDYFISALLRMCRQFAAELTTPFIHHSRCDLASPLFDAYITMTAYSTKTPATARAVSRLHVRNLSQLILEPSKTVEYDLEALQAFVLYQIIGLFDGTWEQRGLAEDHQAVFRQKIIDLEVRSNCTDMALGSDWETWTLNESIRRTIVVAEHVHSVYSVTRKGFCSLDDTALAHYVTGHAGLWAARTAFAWESLVAAGANPYIISRFDVAQFVTGARADDLDALGAFLVVAGLGVDAARQMLSDELRRGVDRFFLNAVEDGVV